MRLITPSTILLGLWLVGCQQADNKPKVVVQKTGVISSADRAQIQGLLRQALHWADANNSISLLPVVTDSQDRVYIGVNLAQHHQNLAQLRATHFFSPGFIDNYNHLVLAIDAGLRSGHYGPWLVGDGPTVVFVSEVNAWCLCQDVPYDHPNPWDNIEIRSINQHKSNVEVAWRWGKLELLAGPGGIEADPGLKEWQAFSYKVLVTKETGKWQIAYLQGFDFKKGIGQYR